MRDDQCATQCEESSPKTRTDPLGVGPGPTVARTVMQKLARFADAEHDALLAYEHTLRMIRGERRRLLGLASRFSFETLASSSREVRELLA